MNQIVSVGTSHHVAPIEFREKLAFSEEQLIEFLQQLRESDQVQEAVILSTCNRVEVYALANSVRNADAAAKMLVEFLARYHQVSVESLKKGCYLHKNLETIRHLFRVISSLDSMVVGESQILGQVKTAYDLSRSAGGVAAILNRLFTKAFSVGKRIRSETTITSGAVSISYAAVELAKKIFNTLEGKTVAIIGAGEMSELTAKHLVANGVSNVIVTNRTYERAVKVAEKFNGTPLAYDSNLGFLVNADIVISSTNAPDYLIKRRPLADIMRKRKHRYMFLIDIAVPRDIDPDVSKVDHAFLYNIDDLEAVVTSNLKDRQQEAVRAEQIVSEEAKRFYNQLQTFQVNPTIKALHQQFREIADTELQACFYKATLSDQQEAAVASMAQAIVKKLLHHPMQNLRCAVNDGGVDHAQYVQALQELFVLDVNDDNSEL
jgi:glutamyl-tRNA reductase